MPSEQTDIQPNREDMHEGTIGRQIAYQSAIRPDQAAIVCAGLEPLSYRNLTLIIDEVRADLRLAGFQKDARIAIALPNGPHAALAIVAISSSAIAVPLNPKLSADEIEAHLKSLRPDAVMVLSGNNSAARRVAGQEDIAIIECVPASHGSLGLKLVTATRPTAYAARIDEPGPDATAFILQTSGTSSEPKSIPFSHGNMLAAAMRLRTWFDLTPNDRCLGVSPVYYSHGLKVTFLTPLLTGGSVAFPSDPLKFDHLQWFGSLKPTWYSAGPTLHRFVLDHMKSIANAKNSHSLRFVLSGGAPLPQDVQEGLQQTLGVPVVEHYGSSEAAQMAANLPKPGASKPGTCGVPWPDTIMIADEDGQKLPVGELGEVFVRGPTVMSGYVNAAELNRKSFANGWFKTGDIGSLDEDGFLTLHGRQHDVINRGGEKIWPAEVDDVLMRHPSVADAAAFAVPHPRLGEDIAAAVKLAPGMTATPLELRSYLIEKLATYKVPRQILIVDELPKGITGKILRRRLSEDFRTVGKSPPLQPGFDAGNLSLELAKVWKRLLNLVSVSADDDFFDIGGDSLLAVEMICELERLVGHPVSTSILFEATTINQLTKKLSEEGSRQPKSIVQISSAADQRPFFYIHGDPGGGNYVKRLAQMLGPNQSVFAVTPHGADSRPVPGSIEEMAAENLSLIRSEQPHGPYRLGGYCTSGLVAFEVARLLVEAGEKVEMVVMVDPPTLNAQPLVQWFFSLLNRIVPRGGKFENQVGLLWFYASKFAKIANLPPAQTWAKIMDKRPRLEFSSESTPVIAGAPHNGRAPSVWGPFARINFGYYFWKYSIAMSRYLPKPLALHVIYFSADHTGRGWKRITPDIELIKLTGDHMAVPADPVDFANHLRLQLQKVRPDRPKNRC